MSAVVFVRDDRFILLLGGGGDACIDEFIKHSIGVVRRQEGLLLRQHCARLMGERAGY